MADPKHVFTPVTIKWATHKTFYTSGYQMANPEHVLHQWLLNANPEHVLHQWPWNGQPKTRLTSKSITWWKDNSKLYTNVY
jgi:hypothetical protein